jgi:hypothetical protein
VDTVTVNAATGSIFVTEANGVTVSDVAVTVTELNADGTTTRVPAQMQSQSDLRALSPTASITLVTGGDLRLTEGADSDGVAVALAGSGTLSLIVNSGDLILEDMVRADKAYVFLRDGFMVDAGDTQGGALDLDIDVKDLTIEAAWGTVLGSAKAVLLDSDASLRKIAGVPYAQVTVAPIGTTIAQLAGSEVEFAIGTARKLTFQATLADSTADRTVVFAPIAKPLVNGASVESIQLRPVMRDAQGQIVDSASTQFRVVADIARFESDLTAERIFIDLGQKLAAQDSNVKGQLFQKGRLIATAPTVTGGEPSLLFSSKLIDIVTPSTFSVDETDGNSTPKVHEVRGPAQGEIAVSIVGDRLVFTRAGIQDSDQIIPQGDAAYHHLTLRSGEVLVGAADAFSRLKITGDGAIRLTGIGNTRIDLSAITSGGSVQANRTLTVSQSVVLHPETDLGGFAINVRPGVTLTLSADQVAQLASRGLSITGDGSVVVRDYRGTQDLSALRVNGALTVEIGLATAVVEPTVTLTQALADRIAIRMVDSALATGRPTLILSPALANQRVITGSGDVRVVGALVGALDLSRVATSDTSVRTLTVTSTSTLDPASNLARFALVVDAAATLSMAVDQANGLTATGAGRIDVTGIEDASYDFTGLATQTLTGSLLAAANSTMRLHTDTQLGSMVLQVPAQVTLSMTGLRATAAAQGGALIQGSGAVQVTDLTATSDLSALQTQTVRAALGTGVNSLVGAGLGKAAFSIPAGRVVSVDASQLVGSTLNGQTIRPSINGSGTLRVAGTLDGLTSAVLLAPLTTATIDLSRATITGAELNLPGSIGTLVSTFMLAPDQVANRQVKGDGGINNIVIDVSALTFTVDPANADRAMADLRIQLDAGNESGQLSTVGDRVRVSFAGAVLPAGATTAVLRLSADSVINLGASSETNSLESSSGTLDISQLQPQNISGFKRVMMNSAIAMSASQFYALLAQGSLSEILGDGTIEIRNDVAAGGFSTQPDVIDLRVINLFEPGGINKPVLHFVDTLLDAARTDSDFSAVENGPSAPTNVVVLPKLVLGEAPPVRIVFKDGEPFGFADATTPIKPGAQLTVYNLRQLLQLAANSTRENIASITLAGNLTLSGDLDLTELGGFASGLLFSTGGFSLTVPAGKKLVVNAAQANGSVLGGAGIIEIIGLTGGQLPDLSNVASDTSSGGGTVLVFRDSNTVIPPSLDLGDLDVRIDAGATLTMTAAQLSGRAITGSGSLEITGVGQGTSVAAVDFSALAPTIDATLLIDRTGEASPEIRFSSGSNLGGADIKLAGHAVLTLTAAQANGRTISESGSVVVTQLGSSEVDLRGLSVPASATIASDVVLAAGTRLPDRLSLTVAPGYQLSLSAEQVTASTGGRSIGGAGSVTVTGLAGGTARLEGVTASGTLTAVVSENVQATLAATTRLGQFDLSISSGATLAIPSSATVGRAIDGLGAIRLLDLATVDLSGVNAVLSVNAAQNLTSINLDDVSLRVDGQGALTLTAAQASQRIIEGSGQVSILGLADTPSADFSLIKGVQASTALVAGDQSAQLDFTGFLGQVRLDIGERYLVETQAANVDGGVITGEGRLIVITGQVPDGQGGVLSAIDAIQRGTLGALAGTYDLDPIDVTVAVDAKLDKGTQIQGDSLNLDVVTQQIQPTQTLTIQPNEAVTITVTDDLLYQKPVDDLTLAGDPLEGLAAGAIVLGATDGVQKIRIGNPDLSLANAESFQFKAPLILNAPGSGGEIKINARIEGTSLRIYGSGATTQLRNDLVMAGVEYIDDALIVFGNRTIESGTGAQPADITITGSITDQGSDQQQNTLSLDSNGGDIRVGGSVLLDGMTIDLRRSIGGSAIASTVTFDQDVTIDAGTLTILVDGNDTVDFKGKLTLLNGAQIVVDGGDTVGNTFRLAEGVATQSRPAALAGADVSLQGMDRAVFGRVLSTLATPADQIEFNAIDSLTLTFQPLARPAMVVSSSDSGLVSIESMVNATDAFNLRGVDLTVRTVGDLELGGRIDLLGGSTLTLESTALAGQTNRVRFAEGVSSTDASGELKQRATIRGFGEVSVARIETANLNVEQGFTMVGVQEARLWLPAASALAAVGPTLQVDALPGQTLTMGVSAQGQPRVNLSQTHLDVSASRFALASDVTVRSLDIRSDAGGSLELAGTAAGRVLSTTAGAGVQALQMRASKSVNIDDSLTISGTGGDARIRPLNDNTTMYVGDLFNPVAGLHVDADTSTFADRIKDFGRLVLGSTSQTGAVFVGAPTAQPHRFADPLVIEVANTTRPVNVVVQGTVHGESLEVSSGSLFTTLGTSLRMAADAGVQFKGAVRVAGDTLIEAKAIEFDGGAGSVTGVTDGPMPTLVLRPLDRASSIGIDMGSSVGGATRLNIDRTSLAALSRDTMGAADAARRFDLQIGYSDGTAGPVVIDGTLSITGAVSVFGETIEMKRGARLEGLYVDLRSDGNMTLTEVRADTMINVQSLEGRIRSLDPTLVNLADRTTGQVLDSVTFYGKGSNVTSTDRALRAEADKVWVTLPNGRVDMVRTPDGVEHYQAADRDGAYRQLVVSKGRGTVDARLVDAASGTKWLLQPAATPNPTLTSLSGFGAVGQAVIQPDLALKSLNGATRAYLERPSNDYVRVTTGGSALYALEQASPLDTLFDPLEADLSYGDVAGLENAWLLGSSSYLPDALGMDSVGGGNFETWSEDELEI